MAKVDRQILEELQAQRALMEQILSARPAVPAPEPQPAPYVTSGRMMTEYDCLLICTADNVIDAIDRWNRSGRAAASKPARPGVKPVPRLTRAGGRR